MAAIRTRGVALASVALCLATRLGAQCADGSPPPCAQAPARPAARAPMGPPDPNRIALLPFRVTTADSLLGEGFAELLAAEFTGEGAPLAVDMGSALSAWRRAGGGLRTPLPRSQAMEVARSLGAGLVLDGSITALGRTITVTATLIETSSGAPRGAPVRVTSIADSLEFALRQVATGLIAVTGGKRTTDGARYTDSPAAMRAYLQGLSAWRRAQGAEAVRELDRAIATDSTFAQAWFRRWFVGLWTSSSGPFAQPAWDRRMRLSPQERSVLEGVLGSGFPAPRTIEERFADRERAASRLPDSPEAQYLIGDYLYHFGAAVDPAGHLARARDYFVRAAALDSSATTLRHLIEVGVRLRDTALLRTVAPDYGKTEDLGSVPGAWLAAVSSGQVTVAAALARNLQKVDRGGGLWVLDAATYSVVPSAAIDEMFARWIAAPQAQAWAGFLGYVHWIRGRPAAALRAWDATPVSERPEIDRMRLTMAVGDGRDLLGIEPVVARLRTAGSDTSVTEDACLLAVWRVRQGDTVGLNAARFARPRASQACVTMLELALMPRDGSAATLARLHAADSSVRNRLSSANQRPEEAMLLAAAWEANGRRDLALRAIRYRKVGLAPDETPSRLPNEGRLALAVGDTAGAVRAWRTWLEITADAEPLMAPKRDSVRVQLARLTRGPTP